MRVKNLPNMRNQKTKFESEIAFFPPLLPLKRKQFFVLKTETLLKK